jgi:hypothetical protein
MRAEDGDFYVGGGAAGGGDGDGASAPPPPAWTVKGADDGSFHSPAWQEQYLKSLTEIKRPAGVDMGPGLGAQGHGFGV